MQTLEQILRKSDAGSMEKAFSSIKAIISPLPYEEAIYYEDSLLHISAELPHYPQAFGWMYELTEDTYIHFGHEGNLFLYLLSIARDPIFDKPEIQEKMTYEIGHSYYELGNNEKAQLTLEKYIRDYKGPVTRDFINSLTMLGLIAQMHQKYDDANIFFHRALDAARLSNDSAWIGLSNGNIGCLYLEMGKIEEALPLIYTDIRLCLKDSMYEGAANDYFDLTKVVLKRHDLTRAKSLIDSSLLMLRLDKRPYRKSWVRVYRNLSRYFSEIGKMDSAYHYLALAEAINDSLQNNKSETLLKIRVNAFTMEKEKQDALLIKASIARSQQNYRFAITAIAGMILVTFFAFVYTTQKKRINRILSEKARLVEAEKLAEEKLRKKEEAANKAKDKLFSLIAHDLRGPISSLGMLLAVLEEGYMDLKDFEKFIPKLKERVDNLYQVTDNLLMWAYSQLDGNITKKEVVNVGNIVHNVFTLLADDAFKKQISLEMDVQKNLKIIADRNQLEIVIRNLVGNAIKFCPSGSTVLMKGFIQEDEVFINICDNGPGVPEKVILNMQEGTFSQPSVGTGGEKGTGLGLVMCKEFIEANGGRLSISPNHPNGTVFSIRFLIGQS
ncbi:tetratricopeptide repeat-containing sensor histidine kinase [Chitinophaga sp.]|uniref:tetratricopeptide repeat-containing sensor histidine kinase n=1 Tax=Chitinophaga sp. TaxID=1869181 RepID=UPI0031D2BF3F